VTLILESISFYVFFFSSETAVYAPGAGLGASKGKDVGKYAEGFSSYVHMAQDSVSKTVLDALL